MQYLMFILVILLFVTIAVINIYPLLREYMRGWSTVIESTLGTFVTYFIMFADTLNEAKALGYLPEKVEYFMPAIILIWIILKRIQTTTQIGKK